MNATLKWVKFEALMIALLPIKGISAPFFNSFNQNRISVRDNSY